MATWRQRLLKVVAYGTGILPGVLSVAAIQTALYGGPFTSGYGSATDLFALANFAPNAVNYLKWLIESETPFVLLAFAAPFFIRDAPKRWLMLTSILCAVATWTCYVFYLVLDAWWYLRYLLTAIPCILALSAVSFMHVMHRASIVARLPVTLALVAAVVFYRIDFARDAGTFISWKLESRYADTGRLIDRRFEKNAILYSGQHSGSLRYYGHRLTVRWNVFEPEWFDRSIRALKEMGYKPYIVLDEGELADFRAALGSKSRYGQLDWKPVAVIQNSPNVSIYDPDTADGSVKP
jgi:hypothetical protein